MTTKTFTWPVSTKFSSLQSQKFCFLTSALKSLRSFAKNWCFLSAFNIFVSYYWRLFEKPGAIWKSQARTEVTQTPWERDTNQSHNHDWWVFVLFWKESEALVWRRMLKILYLVISSQYLNIGVFSLYIYFYLAPTMLSHYRILVSVCKTYNKSAILQWRMCLIYFKVKGKNHFQQEKDKMKGRTSDRKNYIH